MPTQDRVQVMEHFERYASKLMGNTWRFLATELARAVINYRNGKDYWQGYWCETMARNIVAKDQDDAKT